MMANGMLAGLVAITAPCAFVQPWAAAVIGLIAGVLVIEAIVFFEHKVKVDDPVGAISVHGVGGLFGVLCVGHLRRRQLRRRAGTSPPTPSDDGVTGILYGGNGGEQLLRPGDRRAHDHAVIFGICPSPSSRSRTPSPRAASAPTRRTRSAASTCPRWASSPTPTPTWAWARRCPPPGRSDTAVTRRTPAVTRHPSRRPPHVPGRRRGAGPGSPATGPAPSGVPGSATGSGACRTSAFLGRTRAGNVPHRSRTRARAA